MANSFVDALNQFNSGLKDLAITRATQSAAERVQQIQLGEDNDMKKRQQLSQLGQEVAMTLSGFGADPARIQQVAQTIKPQQFQNANDMYEAGISQGSDELKAGAKDLQAFEQGPALEKMNKQLAAMESRMATGAQTKAGDKLANAETKLFDIWNKNPITKMSQVVAIQRDKIMSAAKQQSAAGDMSMIFGLMRMQDPESTVRDSEYATAENAKGVSEYIRGLYNKAKDGQKLTPMQRADFMKTAQNMYIAQIDQQERLDMTLKNRAKSLGIAPERLPLGEDLFGKGYGRRKNKDGSVSQGVTPQSASDIQTKMDINKYLIEE